MHSPKLGAVIECDALSVRALEKRQHFLTFDNSLGRIRVKRAAGVKRTADAPEFVVGFRAAIIKGSAHSFACFNSSEPLKSFQDSLTPNWVTCAAQCGAHQNKLCRVIRIANRV